MDLGIVWEIGQVTVAVSAVVMAGIRLWHLKDISEVQFLVYLIFARVILL